MHTLIDGIRVYYKGDPKAQPVIFIHGFPFDHTLWDETIRELKDDYYCVTYDIRGFGDSEVDCGQYTMEGYVNDLEQIISQLDLRHVIVCGFSMGGYIALRASERLQNFKALILANTTSTGDNDEAKLKRANAIQSIEDEGIAPFLDKFFPAAFTKDYLQNHQDTIAHLKEKISDFDPVGVKGGLLAMITRTDTTDSLDKTPPALLITASEDAVIPPKAMREAAAKMHDAKLVELPDCGHVSMLQKPREFVEALRSFLKKTQE
ncbi:MAG: alpha/beta fold hydrolase [Campylobacterota bacterium]